MSAREQAPKRLPQRASKSCHHISILEITFYWALSSAHINVVIMMMITIIIFFVIIFLIVFLFLFLFLIFFYLNIFLSGFYSTIF